MSNENDYYVRYWFTIINHAAALFHTSVRHEFKQFLKTHSLSPTRSSGFAMNYTTGHSPTLYYVDEFRFANIYVLNINDRKRSQGVAVEFFENYKNTHFTDLQLV